MIPVLGDVLTFQFGGFYGGSIGNLLAYWEQAGVFSYVLPFLLIFALVFGILTQANLFTNNRSINGVLALVVGLLALQFDFVPVFFSEIFPRVGVALAILLIIIIFLSMFSNPEDKWQMYLMWGIGAIIVIVVLLQTAGAVGFYSFLPWLGYNWPQILAIVGFIIILAIIVNAGRPKSTTRMDSPLARALRGQ